MKIIVRLFVAIVFVFASSVGFAASTAETKSEQLADLAEGFRDIPWGTQEKEAKSFGLNRENFDRKTKVAVYVRKNEELRFGGIPLLGIQYIFVPRAGFATVAFAATPEHARPLLEECINVLGQPTATSNTTTEWTLAHVDAQYQFQPGTAPMVFIRPSLSRAIE